MYCPNCGTEYKEGVKFCAQCGQNLVSQHSSPDEAPSSLTEPDASVANPESPETKGGANTASQQGNPKRKALLIGALVVACLAIAGIAFYIFTSSVQKTEAVLITNSIEGLNTSTGTKIPIQVTGTDTKGNAYDQRFYADGEEPLEVPCGSYTFSVAASPIAQDGTIYSVEGATVDGVVGDGGLESAGIEISLDPIPATDVTDEQIEAAYEAAKEGGAADESTATVLKDAATKRRDDAVAQKQAEEEAAQKAADEAAAAAAAEEAAAQEQADQSSSTSTSGSYTAAQAANKLAGSQWQYASGSSSAVTSIQFGSGGDGHESTFNKATGQEESDSFMMSYDAERSDGTIFVYVLSYDSGRTMSVHYNPAADTLTDGDGISLTRIR